MERLEKFRTDFINSLGRLKESYSRSCKYNDKEEYSFYRDFFIQRFEFTFEIFWKILKFYLCKNKGIYAGSPKSVFRELLSIAKETEDKTRLLLLMSDDRNLTVNTYHEEIAEEIFEKLGKYIELMENIVNRII